MKTVTAYIILYNGNEWEPRECEILEETLDRNGHGIYKVQYRYNNQLKKASIPGRNIFFTYNAAKAFAEHYSISGN